jgi:Zn-dependent peptidase ImmA (M78 family)
MTRRIGTIRRLALSLLQKANQDGPEIDVKKIAEQLGAEIRKQDLKDISGLLFREGERIIIAVNETQHELRQRFTIAHEIGHLQLHSHNQLYIDKLVPVRLRRDQASSEAIYTDEIEANAFAAELLMPFHLLQREEALQRKAVDYEGGIIQELAGKYQVSQQAMTFRLINLGFIESPF